MRFQLTADTSREGGSILFRQKATAEVVGGYSERDDVSGEYDVVES